MPLILEDEDFEEEIKDFYDITKQPLTEQIHYDIIKNFLIEDDFISWIDMDPSQHRSNIKADWSTATGFLQKQLAIREIFDFLVNHTTALYLSAQNLPDMQVEK